MKEIIIDGSRMMQVSDNPKILVSLKSKIDFSTLSNSAKEALLKKHFSIDSYRDFEQSHGDKIFGIDKVSDSFDGFYTCLLYTSPSPRDKRRSAFACCWL